MNGGKALSVESWCRAHNRPFLRFDQLGHGESSGQFTDGTIGRWAEDTVAVLDTLCDGPQVIVGSSMGGWVMLLAALARPQKVVGLLGLAPAPDFTDSLLQSELSPEQRQELEENGICYLPSDYCDEPYPLTKALFDDGQKQSLLHDTIAYHGSVRILHGQQDEAVPWERSLTLTRQLASDDVVCTFIKASDHRLSTPQDLERINATLADLLAHLDRSPEQ